MFFCNYHPNFTPPYHASRCDGWYAPRPWMQLVIPTPSFDRIPRLGPVVQSSGRYRGLLKSSSRSSSLFTLHHVVMTFTPHLWGIKRLLSPFCHLSSAIFLPSTTSSTLPRQTNFYLNLKVCPFRLHSWSATNISIVLDISKQRYDCPSGIAAMEPFSGISVLQPWSKTRQVT